MRLLYKQDIKEAEKYPRGYFLSYGNKIRDDGTVYGWYVKIELPFKKTKMYIHPYTFDETHGKCAYTLVFVNRLRHTSNKRVPEFMHMWVPVDL